MKELPFNPKIHYSELDQYLSCPQAYYQRYVLGVKDTEKSSALTLGTALHLAIKTHFEGENGLELFQMYWESVKDTPMIYYRHNWEMLNDLAVNKWIPNFIKFHAKKYLNPVMEQLSEMPLYVDPVHGQIYLEGTFDMFSDYCGIPTLTDWKTSSKKYTNTKILKNPQMYIYAALVKAKIGVLPKAIQYKVFCKHDGSIQTLQLELTQEKLDEQLKNVTLIIKNMIAMRASGQWYCNFNNEYCKHG